MESTHKILPQFPFQKRNILPSSPPTNICSFTINIMHSPCYFNSWLEEGIINSNQNYDEGIINSNKVKHKNSTNLPPHMAYAPGSETVLHKQLATSTGWQQGWLCSPPCVKTIVTNSSLCAVTCHVPIRSLRSCLWRQGTVYISRKTAALTKSHPTLS